MRIEIKNLPVDVLLGYYPEEQERPQTSLVSLTVHLDDPPEASGSDQLEHTVDYGQLIKIVDRTVEGQTFKLVETLVQCIGAAVMRQQPRIVQLDVRVVKTRLPHNCARGAEVSVSKSFFKED